MIDIVLKIGEQKEEGDQAHRYWSPGVLLNGPMGAQDTVTKTSPLPWDLYVLGLSLPAVRY